MIDSLSDQMESWASHPFWDYLWPILLGIALFLVGLTIARILGRRLTQWAQKTRRTGDDILVQVIRGPLVLWCLIGAIYVTVIASPVSETLVEFSGRILAILWIVSMTLVFLRLADQIVHLYGSKLSAALPLTSLTQNLAKGMILVMGGLIILNSLGVSITPLLTALGVGGLAVALALQDTLGNLFSGIYITMARQVRVGDYIKLESGEEGCVVDIAWRSTRIRHLANYLIVIPNTKLAQAIVTNYDLPTPDMAVLVEMGVHYRCDLEEVERVTSEVAREVMKSVTGGVPAFEPFIRYHTFGDHAVKFTVILRGKTFVDQYLVKHEFIKKAHQRFQERGIVIPYPTQVVISESAEDGVPQNAS